MLVKIVSLLRVERKVRECVCLSVCVWGGGGGAVLTIAGARVFGQWFLNKILA
jgi:hypothetical protein